MEETKLNKFGIEYIPQEVLSKIKYKSITHTIFRIQSDDSVMCGFNYQKIRCFILCFTDSVARLIKRPDFCRDTAI